MLFRNRALSLIPKADLVALLPSMTEVGWGPGQPIYEVGEPVEEVHFPSTAGISVVSVMSDGQEVECASVGYEGAVGLLPGLSGGVSSSRAYVQLAGSGISILASALRRQGTISPDLLTLLLRAAQALIAQQEQSVGCNALHDVEPRLARWLLICDDRLDVATLPLTQDYLAVMLGVQRSTVSGAAGTLREEGLIRYSRGQLEIIDRPRLEARSCECYAAAGRMHDRLLAPAGGP